MTERTKDWIFNYFVVGFFWAFFAGMFQLALGPTELIVWAITFLFNLTLWPLSMISALIILI